MNYREPQPANTPPSRYRYGRVFYFNKTVLIEDSVLFETILKKAIEESLPQKIKALYKTDE